MNIFDKLFCSHRHNIEDHPQCFAVGNVNPVQAQEIYERYGKPWYQVEGLKIGYLDIETDNLKADFGTMLTWCIKEKEGPVTYDKITRDELFSGEVDRRIVRSLVEELGKYKIIATYYGTGFDLPFVRTKALHYNMNFPGYVNEEHTKQNGEIMIRTLPELYHFDLYYLVKSKLCLSRKRLETVCEYLGIEGKTPLRAEIWQRAKYGDPEALGNVLEHNLMDTVILEQLHNKMEPYSKFTRKSV